MRVLWICALPLEVQQIALQNEDHGAQVAASWIVAHLPPPEQVDLHIACLWPGGDEPKTIQYKGAKVHLLPCPRRGRVMLLFQRDTIYFRSLFKELKPDLVHGWGTEDSFGLVARRLAPFHHLIGIQGLVSAYRKRVRMNPRTLITAMTEKMTLGRARYVVAESEYALREARPLCPRAKFSVIEQPLRHEFLAATLSNGGATTALFVGAIQERKGIRDALIAFARAAPQHWKLHVIGSGLRHEEQSLHRLVKRLQLGERFRHDLFGTTEEIVRAMQASSIFLLPTHIDTGPNALKEALTMGLWPVCYDNSGPGEYIRKYAFGSLATDRNVQNLSANLKDSLTNMPWKDLERRRMLERQTRRDFSREHAWEQLIEFYRMIDSNA